jgi:2-methylcitrate dehydratase PrpD
MPEPTAAQTLAAYAASLRFEDIPPSVVERARQCLVDAVACAAFGRQFPWSTMVLEEATATGAGGPCRLPGVLDQGLHVPQAALALGVFAHAFELDNLRKPGLGVHGGATVALPALAMAQALKSSGRELITAIVAGIEVMFRIGTATLHTPEEVGFHAPGLTGPFGAATACASLMKLSPAQIANAFGIAGSLAGGLLAFAKAGSGGMIKRLHLGRAAEGGVLAARLAQRGYEGPLTVLEGRYGLLEAFCEETDATLLTKDLGRKYETERICFKRYPCHVTAHAPIELLRGLMEQHGFAGDDISEVTVDASAKVVSHHAEQEPADIMLAQYSVPFSMALSAYYDPLDPFVFSERAIAEARIRDLAKRVRVTASGRYKGWSAGVSLRLRDGRAFDSALDAFTGTPERPLSADQLRLKFERLTQRAAVRPALLDELMAVDRLASVDALAAG